VSRAARQRRTVLVTGATGNVGRNLVPALLAAGLLAGVPSGEAVVFGAGLLLAIVLMALLAPWISPYDPYAQNLAHRTVPPFWYEGGSWAHPLGTDPLGRDVLVEPHVVFAPGVTVEEGATIRAFSHLECCVVRRGATVGPYARIRPGSEVGAGAQVGNFVELKAATLGAGAKANHLTYLGDVTVGADLGHLFLQALLHLLRLLHHLLDVCFGGVVHCQG